MHARKTGALIRAAAGLGAIAVGADKVAVGAIDDYARELGLAFQIVDDMLDVEGSPAALGKTAGKDAAAGKPTYPALFGLDSSRRMAADCVVARRARARSRRHRRAARRDRALESRTPQLMARTRLDQRVVAAGLAASRERARALILAGDVSVNGAPATKAGTLVDDAAAVTLRTPDHPWVGRGGIKLAHALDVFQIDPAGRLALDIGASTGGFTDVLLQHGAAKVVALDVGRGQLDWKLRSDPRVVVIEGVNARHLTPDAAAGGRPVVRPRHH